MDRTFDSWDIAWALGCSTCKVLGLALALSSCFNEQVCICFTAAVLAVKHVNCDFQFFVVLAVLDDF